MRLKIEKSIEQDKERSEEWLVNTDADDSRSRDDWLLSFITLMH